MYLMVFLCFFFTSIVIAVWRAYKVNYVKVFDIHKNYKMNQWQFIKMFLNVWAIFSFICILEISSVKGYLNISAGYHSWPTMVLVIVILIMWIFPFDYLERSFRFELIKVLGRNIFTPFFKVRFRDFFFGDVLTSLTSKLVDNAYLACYFLHHK